MIPAGRAEAAADRLQERGAGVTFGAYEAARWGGPGELRGVEAFVDQRVGD